MTTRLGYGCSSLMASLGMRESLALLDAAYDAGIRHFDTAPAYGFGAAERCLGEFARRHAGDVTITTKYGIPPAKNQSIVGAARGIVKPFIQQLPGVKQHLARLAKAATRPSKKNCYTEEGARASLERSLRELQTERLDVWLLHEATAMDLQQESLFLFLEQAVAAGKVGTFGIGSEASKIPALYGERRPYCRILQFEWSVFDPIIDYAGTFCIHHRSLSAWFPVLCKRLAEEKTLRARWSDSVGLDLGKKENVSALMLKAALELNPDSVILFSSKRVENIAANVQVAENANLKESALRLYALIQAERKAIFATSV